MDNAIKWGLIFGSAAFVFYGAAALVGLGCCNSALAVMLGLGCGAAAASTNPPPFPGAPSPVWSGAKAAGLASVMGGIGNFFGSLIYNVRHREEIAEMTEKIMDGMGLGAFYDAEGSEIVYWFSNVIGAGCCSVTYLCIGIGCGALGAWFYARSWK